MVDEYRGPIEPGVERGGTIADAMIDLGGGWVIREPRLAVAEQVQLAVLHADGIVVPQLLADSDEAVVLDPRGRRMFSVDQATATLLGRTDTDYGSLTDAPIPACAITRPGDLVCGSRYRVAAMIAGVSAQLVVDTGADRTRVFAESAAGAARFDGELGDIEIGRFNGSGPIGVSHFVDHGCPIDGELGLGATPASCALLLAPDHAVARCPIEREPRSTAKP